MFGIETIRQKSFNASSVVLYALLGFVIPTQAYALDQRAEAAFSTPVEIPGKVLQPGTYVFKVLDFPGNRNIVQAFDKSGKLYSTFMTVPDFNVKDAGKPAVGFEEPAAGSPMVLSELFFPGTPWGNHVVYPLNRATEIAKKTKQNVFFMPTGLTVNLTLPVDSPEAPTVRIMRFTDIKAIKPSGEEMSLADATAPGAGR